MKHIYTAFKQRSPLATLLFSLILGPVMGMLYLSKGRAALGYLFAMMLIYVAPHLLGSERVFSYNAPKFSLILAVIHFLGAAHTFIISKKAAYAYMPRWYSRWYVLLLIAAVPIAGALLFRHYAYEPFVLRASSMEPNLKEADMVWVKKSAYRAALPERGDVVAFRNKETVYLKRIVGLPGEAIQMKAGVLYIDGEAVSYTPKEPTIYEEQLPEGARYLVLDTTPFGEADYTETYHVPKEHYFVLGDNRDNSLDSRYSKYVGFVALKAILGEVISKPNSH